jgi:hypothetical protein
MEGPLTRWRGSKYDQKMRSRFFWFCLLVFFLFSHGQRRSQKCRQGVRVSSDG